MTAHTHTNTGFEELTHRDSNGIHVTLLWNRDNDKLRVAVFDNTTDTAFQLDVGDKPPLDVFNHPYAYAAFQQPDHATLVEPIVHAAIAA